MVSQHCDWQQVIARCRLFVLVWSDQAPLSTDTSTWLAYANAIGKPIRILLADDVRLPEDAFLSLDDVEVARAETPAAAQAQIAAWLEALPKGPGAIPTLGGESHGTR